MVGTTVTGIGASSRRMPGGHEDVRVVREQDHLDRRGGLDRRRGSPRSRGSSSVRRRRRCAPRLSSSRRFPAPDGDGDQRAGGSARRRGARAGAAARARASARACRRSRRRRSTPAATPSESARPGSSVWRWTLTAERSPTTSSESPSGSNARSSASGSSRVALDDEDRAVAVRERAPDGAPRRGGAGAAAPGALRQRLPASTARDPAHDLDEPGRAGVDDARLGEHRQHARASRRRTRLPAASTRREVAAALGLLGELADRGQHRPLDRACARRGRRRRSPRAAPAASSSETRSDSAAPRMICERITPGVPARAHQRGTGDLVGERRALVARPDSSSASTTARDGEREVGARVAVGDRVDVEVVDPAPVGLDRGEPAAREREHARAHAAHAVTRTSSTTTSTEATGSPVSRSSS